jgi:hypothetical protein
MITEEQKQEADSVVEKYNKNYTLNAEPIGYQTRRIATPNKYQCAIQDRQSVLEAIMPLHSYCTTLELHDKIMNEIQSLTNQIEYLKSKL